MRTVLIRIEGTKHPVRKLQLREGTRVRDILQTLKVPEGCTLSLAADPTHPFPSEADIQSVADGERLVIRSNSSPVEITTPFTLTLSH